MLMRLFTSFLVIVSLTVIGSPPPNDLCNGAEAIPGSGPFPFSSTVVDIKEATTAGDPGVPSCASFTVTNSVWYVFTPATTALYTLSANTDTATTVSDTVMAIYTSAGGCGGPFTQIFCNDDEGDLQSAISTQLTGGVTYYIVIWRTTLSSTFLGSAVQLKVAKPVTPPNDTCGGAEIIPAGGPFPYLTSTNDTTLATTAGDPPAPACWPDHVRSVWFKFTPDTTTTYELTLCTNTATTIYETLLAVYTAASPCASFSQVACNHTTPCGNVLRSTITTPLTNGITYYIVSWEGVNDVYIPGETSLQLRVTRFLGPVATTLGSSNLTLTSAALNGSVNPNNLPTTAWFEWGTTTNYGSLTPSQALAPGNFTVPVSATVNGLTAGTTYRFRLRATNSLGASLGLDQSFVAASAPSATTLSAYGLTSTGAVLQASVTPNAATTYAWFQFGLTTNYGSVTAPANLGASTSPVILQSAIAAVSPGSLHHFRFVASNSVGTSFGTNRTFAWSSTPPHFTGFYETNSGFTLRFNGQSNQLYAVEYSTNLTDWTGLGLSTELGGGLFQLIAPDAAPEQFFRVLAP